MNDYIFKPLSPEQQELADQLTEHLEDSFFVEKRDPDNRFYPGILIPYDSDGTPLRVLVTGASQDEGVRVLITNREFDKMLPAELICELDTGEKIRLRGRADATRPGRRMVDRKQTPPVMISHFRPDQR